MTVSLINFLIARVVAQNQGLSDPQAVNRDALPAALIPNPALGVGISAILAQQDAAAQPPPSTGQGAGSAPSQGQTPGLPAPPSSEEVLVPDLVTRQDGTKYSLNDAEKLAQESQLTVATIPAYSAIEPKGQVILQDPSPDALVPLGSAVTLYVSDGPPPPESPPAPVTNGSLERLWHTQRQLERDVDRTGRTVQTLERHVEKVMMGLEKLGDSVHGLAGGQIKIEEMIQNLTVGPLRTPAPSQGTSPTEPDGAKGADGHRKAVRKP